MKYLLWALVIYLLWRWYETRKLKQDAADPPPATAASASDPEAVEKMVACAECGIHLPLSEALPGPQQLHYCCDAHRLAHAHSRAS